MTTLNSFDATQIDPTFVLEPLPAGTYLAAITGTENKRTKAGDGSYLEFTFQVLEGQYKDRILWSRLNLDNPNATAVKIAKAELSAICRAVGVLQPRDSCELHNIPIEITVALRKRDDGGEMTNNIRKYSRKGAARPSAPATPAARQAPWQRPSPSSAAPTAAPSPASAVTTPEIPI